MTGVSILEKKGGNGFRRPIALINLKGQEVRTKDEYLDYKIPSKVKNKVKS